MVRNIGKKDYPIYEILIRKYNNPKNDCRISHIYNTK